MEKKKFNVLAWDFNSDSLRIYDVMPYLRSCYAKRTGRRSFGIDKYGGRPKTRSEFRDFVDIESKYMFWSRCQWEIICHGLPVQKNEHKLDVYEQIKMNIDIIVDILYEEYGKD